MSKPDRSDAFRRLGRILYVLSAALGIAELGIISRASEWLSYSQLGQLGAFYTFALLIGVTVAPAIRRVRTALAVSVILSSLPIVGIGVALLVLPAGGVFDLVRVLWPLSAIGAGILDNVQSSLAVRYSTRGRADSVAMLAVRHVGTLLASVIAVAAVAGDVQPGIQYIVIGVVLVLPLFLSGALPAGASRQVSEAAPHRPGHRSASILVVMGFFAASAVLPVSLTWAWAEPVMKELHAGPHTATYALTLFVIAQGVSCVVYFRRSAKHHARRLVLGGLWVAAIGVGVLLTTAVQVHHPFMTTALAQQMAMGGMALFGWGVAPLPMVVMNRVGSLRLRLSTRSRVSRTVLVQCLLVSGGNYAFGHFAGLYSGFDAYVVTALICVVALLLCMRLLPAQKPASA